MRVHGIITHSTGAMGPHSLCTQHVDLCVSSLWLVYGIRGQVAVQIRRKGVRK